MGSFQIIITDKANISIPCFLSPKHAWADGSFIAISLIYFKQSQTNLFLYHKILLIAVATFSSLSLKMKILYYFDIQRIECRCI